MRIRNLDIVGWVLMLVAMMALTSCGGGGTTVAGGGGGITGTGKQVVGEVTGFGSIFVNGVEFNTVGAAITIDDLPAAENALKAGMIVKVNGRVDDLTRKGTAVTVVARDAIEGRIDALDSGTKTITVMGQLVRIEDNVTRFNDNDAVKTFAAAGFAINDLVEVHGYPDDTGGLRATRVLVKGSGEFETKGFVTSLGANSFGLAQTPNGTPFLTVRYSSGQLPTGFAAGSKVQVKTTAPPAAGEIIASLIKLEDRVGAAGERVAVEGFVTGGSVTDFEITGQRVITDSATLFEGGVKGDFAPGVKLEAEGTMNAAGTVVASRIAFRSTIKLEGDASNVQANSLTVLGRQVATNSFTRIDPGLANGSHIEVRALLDRNGNLLASRVVVLGASSRAVVQGPLSAYDANLGTLTILGMTLVSDGSTQWRTSSTASELAVDKALFFSQLRPYSVVKVRWDPFGAVTDVIKEAEIELGR